jgi:type 1 glutamine amidotransferase
MKRFFVFACLVALACASAQAMAASPRKILVVTTALGWRHSSIETAEQVIASLGKSSGAYEVELAAVPPAGNADAAAYQEQVKATLQRKLDRDALKQYHGIVFASTTGELPLPDKAALIQWVRDGGAFIGIHSASDTLHGFRPYIEMLGGEFDYHREQVLVDAINRDASHPANRHLPASWNLDGQKEEIYVLKNFQQGQVRELIVLDRHPNTGAPGHFPISWCRDFGKGRVFYTALGHNEQVWQMPAIQQHVLGGIEWALGLK